MESIRVYRDLINRIPVNNQSAMIKKDVWERISYNEKIKKAIFGRAERVEISREDIHSEGNIEKRIIMTLM